MLAYGINDSDHPLRRYDSGLLTYAVFVTFPDYQVVVLLVGAALYDGSRDVAEFLPGPCNVHLFQRIQMDLLQHAVQSRNLLAQLENIVRQLAVLLVQ